jgi:hypothetical protein
VVAAALAQLHDVLGALTALSLTGLSDGDVSRVLDAGTATPPAPATRSRGGHAGPG